MRSSHVTVLCSALLAFATTLAFAQAPEQPPTPGPEHKRFEYFVGTWVSEAVMKPSPLGPGGKVTGRDSCEMFKGGFHVVCRSEMSGWMGPMSALGIWTWSAAEKKYLTVGIDSMGSLELGSGTVSDKTWTLSSETKMAGQVMASRYTLVETSPDAYTFKWEMSLGGGPWALISEGTSTRVK